jgi:hypothetical protein
MSAGARWRLPCMAVEGGSGAVVVRVPGYGASDALADAERLLSRGSEVVVVVVLDAGAPVDVGTVGALARLVLLARRSGAQLLVQASGAELVRLADFLGLCDALRLRVEPIGPLQGSGQPQG